jgi:cytochrome b561/polyisoprenoid-binding protein YceI
VSPTSTRYSTVAVILHWMIAAAIIFMVILGWRMGDEPKGPSLYAIFQLHKSIGITILLLTLVRVGWRLANPPPPYAEPLGTWEHRASQAVHLGFYAAMILMPLSGWVMVSASKVNIPTLLYGIVPWPHVPGVAELSQAARHNVHEGSEAVHGLVAKILAYGLLPLHVGGALKHHFISRDGVLGRMIPGVKRGAFLDPRAWATALVLVGVIAAGYAIYPPHKAVKTATPPAQPASEAPAAEAPAPALPAAASPAAPPSKATADAQPVAWVVSKGSSLSFDTSWSGAAISGSFKRWTANIVFSPDALEASRATVTIDTASASTGDAQRDETLPSGDWFDSAANPKAVFSATRFRKLGGDRYEARGTLSLRGVTRPALLPFSLKINGDTAKVRGVTSLDRTAFGVGQGEWTATDQIPAAVSVTVNLTATRKL